MKLINCLGLLMRLSRLWNCRVYMSWYFGISEAKLRIDPCCCPCVNDSIPLLGTESNFHVNVSRTSAHANWQRQSCVAQHDAKTTHRHFAGKQERITLHKPAEGTQAGCAHQVAC